MNTAAQIATISAAVVAAVLGLLAYRNASAAAKRLVDAADVKDIAELRAMIGEAASSEDLKEIRRKLGKVSERVARIEGRHQR